MAPSACWIHAPGVKGGPPGPCGLDTVESQLGHFERIDEGVDHANGIVLVDPLIEALRQKHPSAIDVLIGQIAEVLLPEPGLRLSTRRPLTINNHQRPFS
jgi:hypothetical protein